VPSVDVKPPRQLLDYPEPKQKKKKKKKNELREAKTKATQNNESGEREIFRV